jgi:predicted amidohydrolase YtcJ
MAGDGSAGGAPVPAGILIRGARIRTLAGGSAGDVKQAIALRDGKVAAVDDSPSGLDHLAGPGTRVVDLPGLTGLPAFDDTHTHLMFAARGVHDVPVGQAGTVEEFVGMIRDRAEHTPEGTWIRTASNWHEINLAERRMPTRTDLDRATTRHPVLVKRGGHNDVVNTFALDQAGITAQTPDPAGGLIQRDEHGQPTGWFTDSAIALVERDFPQPPDEELIEGLRVASRDYAAKGIGTVRDAAVSPAEMLLLRRARQQGALAVRTRPMILVAFAGAGEPIDAYLDRLEAEGIRPGAGDDWLRVWGLKIVLDGGVENAALEAPYANQPDFSGQLMWEPEEFVDTVERAVRRGWRVGTHAWGDRAVRTLFECYEQVLERNPGLAPGTLVAEHAGLPHAADRVLAVRLGIPVTVQHPLFAGLAPALIEYWGRERTAEIFPLREWLDEGADLSAGSDFPNGSYAAMASLSGMVTRDTKAGVLGPGHAITRSEALVLHTTRAARLTGEQATRGALQPGYAADLAFYPEDPLTAPIDEVANLLPVLTILAGQPVHDPAGVL